ncbi:hypothetical protein S7711_06922 [Stachybotrys chartarum IBT 7711]|uniref:Cutinase n=1 Tax=Stachybotrys chartarum (strain CBS 109288 / IBT 7711) TaxID=1280523 RepID=A0A084AL35_STACB|nr:hypothetical protein S7711_06922 [Stachybotrys chartarum IBT 7711]
MRVRLASLLLMGNALACDDVHVFLARGNNEPYPGRQGVLAQAICTGLESCGYEDIAFYNPLPAPYCQSVTEGQANGMRQITEYNERCPDSRLVVSGYSQGGHVVGDILGGGGGVFFQDCVQEYAPGLDADSLPGSKIVAAMIFADTRHTAGQPYNVFSGAGADGLFPRSEEQVANLARYGDRLRDFCVDTDPICAGGDIVDTHLNYFDIYTGEAASWVQEMVAADMGSTSTSTQPTSTTRATSTTLSQVSMESSDTIVTETETSEAVSTTSMAASTDTSVESSETTSAASSEATAESSVASTEALTSATGQTSAPEPSATSAEPEDADGSGIALGIGRGAWAIAIVLSLQFML